MLLANRTKGGKPAVLFGPAGMESGVNRGVVPLAPLKADMQKNLNCFEISFDDYRSLERVEDCPKTDGVGNDLTRAC